MKFNEINDKRLELEVRVAKKVGKLTEEDFTVSYYEFTGSASYRMNMQRLNIQQLGIINLINPLMDGENEYEEITTAVTEDVYSVIVESENHFMLVYIQDGYVECEYVLYEKDISKIKKVSKATKIDLDSIPNS